MIFSIAAPLLLLGANLVAAQRGGNESAIVTFTAVTQLLGSGDPTNYQLDASNGAIVLDAPGTTSATAFNDHGNGNATLDVTVPWGQAVYVAANGSLSYTKPGALDPSSPDFSQAIPAGSFITTFALQGQVNGSPVFKFLNGSSSGSPITSNTGFLGCLGDEEGTYDGDWKVYANLTGVDYSWARECYALNPVSTVYDGPAVYAY